MTKFLNMKIAITPEQPLDEVVMELERLGCVAGHEIVCDGTHDIVIVEDGMFFTIQVVYSLITLAELKEME